MERAPRWKELSHVAASVDAPATLRRRAERMLAARVPDLALGERVALARSATRGVIPTLVATADSAVLLALLHNVRLVEDDVLRMASSEATPGEILARLAGDPRWGPRRSVGAALAANPRSPVSASLRAASYLPPSDLRRLVSDAKVPKIVRVSAARLLASAGHRETSPPASRAPARGPA
jgi:hypothetical protein